VSIGPKDKTQPINRASHHWGNSIYPVQATGLCGFCFGTRKARKLEHEKHEGYEFTVRNF